MSNVLQLREQVKQWAGALKRDVHAVYLAARDPRTPWYAKSLALVVAAYALSPIDLIPDFIPILGYVDELFIIPIGIALTIRLIPAHVLEEHRARGGPSPTASGQSSSSCCHPHRMDGFGAPFRMVAIRPIAMSAWVMWTTSIEFSKALHVLQHWAVQPLCSAC